MKLKGKMARLYTIIAAIMSLVAVVAIVSILNGCSCADNPEPMPTPSIDVMETPTEVLTEAPTLEPTEVPTEAPTEAPTEVPEGWYTDPTGIIPQTIEILVHDINTANHKEQWCITRIDGNVILQQWTPSGLENEWEVPEGLLEAKEMYCFYDSSREDELAVYAYYDVANQDPIFYIENKQGEYLYCESTSYTDVIDPNDNDRPGIAIATTDGKLIWYTWGNNFYRVHDFFGDVTIDSDAIVKVNNDYYYLDEITEWKMENFKK